MPEGTLRVVHVVCSDAFAGVETYLTYVAPALQRQGVEVAVAGGDPVRMAAELAPWGIEHHRVARPSEALRLLTSAAMRRQPPDLVHVHMTEAEVAAIAARPVLRRPIVATLHFARPRGRDLVRRGAFSVVPHLVARQVAISAYVARASGQRCDVIPHGVPDPGEPSTAGGATGGPRTVLVAQRFEPEKRTEAALEAWRRSGLPDAGWTLVLAGGGSEEATLQRRIGQLGLQGSVVLRGFLAPDDLRHEMRMASIFLAPTPIEGFGFSVVEAMARGLPVVASASGAHLETVGPADRRYLFDVDDPAAGGEALRSLAADDGERRRYGLALRQRYLAEYTIDRHAERLAELYRQVVGATGRRRDPNDRSARGAARASRSGA